MCKYWRNMCSTKLFDFPLCVRTIMHFKIRLERLSVITY